MPRTFEEIFSPAGPVTDEEVITPLVIGCPAYSSSAYFPKATITEQYCGVFDDLVGVSCTLFKTHSGPHISHAEDFTFVWPSIPQLPYPGDKTWPSTQSNKISIPPSPK